MTHPRGLSVEERRARDRARYHRNLEKKRQQMRESRLRHREARRAYDRRRYHNDPDRHSWQINQACSWWRANEVNRAKFNQRVQERRRWVKRATPPWLSAEHKARIAALYLEAQRRGGWHVDHIHPLRGENLCGLHVPWNLQLLSADQNRRKRNLLNEA